MKDHGWRSILSVVEHTFVSTLMFVVVTAAAVFGSRFAAIALQQIESRFVIYALLFLKFVIVVLEVGFALVSLIKPAIEKLRSFIR